MWWGAFVNINIRKESLPKVVGGVKRFSNEDDEISEDMIEFLTTNPIIIRKWQNLAHQVN